MSNTPDYTKSYTGKNGRKYPSVADRFWEKVDRTGECWLWTAPKTHNGYGRFKLNGNTVRAHRFSYELLEGPIPEGLTIDHLCRNRACVRPDHLEAVTMRENHARGKGTNAIALRTNHCKNGHPFDEHNTYVRKDTGGRECRECRRMTMASLRARSQEVR